MRESPKVRPFSVIYQNGPGSVFIDADGHPRIVMSASTWLARSRLEDPPALKKFDNVRISTLLNVDYVAVPNPECEDATLPMQYFPTWYYCPKCKRFETLDAWRRLDKECRFIKEFPDESIIPQCPECNKDLVVFKYVTACCQGHLNNFPVQRYVHSTKNQCKSSSYSLINEGNKQFIKCAECGSKRELSEQEIARFKPDCDGFHPWRKRHKQETCSESAMTMEVTASALYNPKVSKFLVLPPFTSELVKTICQFPGFFTLRESYDKKKPLDSSFRKAASRFTEKFLESQQEKIQISSEKLQNYIERIVSSLSTFDDSEMEFDILSGRVSMDLPNQHFNREKVEIPKLDFVKGISVITELHGIFVLEGFTRLPHLTDNNKSKDINESNLVSVSTNQSLPGIESVGEGIFIEVDLDQIREKIDALNLRSKLIFPTKQVGDSEVTVSLEYVVIHTLSHMLIRELSRKSGYSGGALREKIYLLEDSPNQRAGILIYAMSNDSVGTLGGLVRLGREDIFPAIYKQACKRSLLCSNDPICAMSTPSEYNPWNYAACYACCFISDLTCETNNQYLDRGLLYGTIDKKRKGIFSDLVERDASLKSKEKKPQHDIRIVDQKECQLTELPQKLSSLIKATDGEQQEQVNFLYQLLENCAAIKKAPIIGGKIKIDDVEEEIELGWPEKKIYYLPYSPAESSMQILQNQGYKIFTLSSDPLELLRLVRS